MNPARITLTVTQGSIKGKEYVFEAQTRCIIGRAEDCNIRLPMDTAHCDISRHHCELDIDPPRIQVRDLGSRNGTFVNGEKIGQRPSHQQQREVDPRGFPAQELNEGDTVQVGHLVFEVKERVAPGR